MKKYALPVEKSPCLAEVELHYKSKVKPADRKKISRSQDCYDILKDIYNANTVEHHEEMMILLLNRANQVLGWIKISQGGDSGTVVSSKIIMQACLLANATSFIVTHNHPSGNLKPSEADIRITKEIKEVAKIMQLAFLDHLIYTPEGWYSFADEGMM